MFIRPDTKKSKSPLCNAVVISALGKGAKHNQSLSFYCISILYIFKKGHSSIPLGENRITPQRSDLPQWEFQFHTDFIIRECTLDGATTISPQFPVVDTLTVKATTFKVQHWLATFWFANLAILCIILQKRERSTEQKIPYT